MAEEKRSWDKRTVGRYMEKGQVTKAEYQSFLKALPDDEKNADWVQMDMDEPEMTDIENGGAEESDKN